MFFYQFSKTQTEQELTTNIERGLTQKEAATRLLKYGLNLLPETPPESWVSIFFRQFKSSLVYILVLCSITVFFLGDREDSVIILAVLVFNAVIGTIQEGRSQNTLASLKKLSESEATVLREGIEEAVLEKEVVPGDILVLREGQKVVADARVVHSSNLSTDEAALTGESGAVLKVDSVISDASVPTSGQKNMLFKGTNVLAGDGLAIVVGTGIRTEIGKISRAIIAAGETEIPLQKNIKRFSKLIIYAVGVISVGLFVLGLLSGRDAREMFAVVVSLAVSVIPEGLPLVLTLILVTGVHRMSKRNALVKKLQAVEALGQASVIAVDKTGTITRNEMAVKKLYVDSTIYTVLGNGYEPVGNVELGGRRIEAVGDVVMAAKIASLASRAIVRFSEKDSVFKVSGDPTEAAMMVLGEKLGFPRESLLSSYTEVAEMAFDYKTKFRAVFYEHGSGVLCAVAGAPEVLIEKAETCLGGGKHHVCDAAMRKHLDAAVEDFTRAGLRVVAFGYKIFAKEQALDTSSILASGISGLVFGGLYGIEDAVRPEAARAVRQAQAAGVKIVMITGDHKHTATAIAREAGIFLEGDEVITGGELLQLTDRELAKRLQKVSVFARVTPEDKMKIIQAYKHTGLIVAMTGDGVNDAPPLVAADLGVAMGKIGTEVAKEAADIILLDDNLSSIVAAIEEGRAMYRNIQKSILFLFSTSAGELLTILMALVLNFPIPILAVQILWLNLITDPLIGTALALDRKEPGLLQQKFQQLPKYFVTKTMLLQIFLVGGTMAFGTLYLFNVYKGADYFKAVTVGLTTLAVFQWYNGFNCMFPSRSIFSGQIFRNPYLWLGILGNAGLQLLAVYHPFFQRILKTTPLTWAEWGMILGICLLVIAVEEGRKIISNIKLKISNK